MMRDVRSLLLMSIILLAFAGLFARASSVMLDRSDKGKTPTVTAVLPPPIARAEIVDRDGVRLAVQIDVPSVAINPNMVWDAAGAARTLAPIVDVPVTTLTQRLADTDKNFVWVARDITPSQKHALLQSGVEGLEFVKETKRTYPNGPLAGHIIGYTGLDDKGLAGIEYAYNTDLSAPEAPKIRLTLDARVQSLVGKNLLAGVDSFQAKAGTAILLDRDGGILALSSAPQIDPNLARKYASDAPARINHATASVYELGSVMKPLTTAYALEQGAINKNDIFPTFAPYKLGRFTIKDTHFVGNWSSLRTIIKESSNIGTLHIFEALGEERIKNMITKLGLDTRLAINLPERSMPLLPEYWTNVSAGSVAYGHGISVSPLHMAAAYTVFTNNGVRRNPYINTAHNIDPGTEVLSPATTATALKWLEAVVEDGTGNRAANTGYKIGGKTGTADVAFEGGYDENRNVCSFAAVFPLDDPRYVLFVTLVEPKAIDANSGHTASWNAAPLSADIIRDIAPILGIYTTPNARTTEEPL